MNLVLNGHGINLQRYGFFIIIRHRMWRGLTWGAGLGLQIWPQSYRVGYLPAHTLTPSRSLRSNLAPERRPPMKAHLALTADNPAFGDTREEAAYELARILYETALRLKQDPETYGRCYETLRDANGNGVGRFCLKGEDDPGYADLR